MLKTVIGLGLAFAVGAACRWFDLPAPAPPKILGALLVATMTLGYLSTDKYLTGRSGSVTTKATTSVQEFAKNSDAGK